MFITVVLYYSIATYTYIATEPGLDVKLGKQLVYVFLQEVKDVYLFGIVGILVLVDIVFLIPPTAVSSVRLRREQKEIEGEEVSVLKSYIPCHLISYHIILQAHDLPAIIGVCTSEGSLKWLPVFFAYKGVVLLAGLFLAFETRKVKSRP